MNIKARLIRLEQHCRPERYCQVVQVPDFVFELTESDLADWCERNHAGKSDLLLVGEPLTPEQWLAQAELYHAPE